eukprot:TRINITY_DN40291_c0_g1_i1.p1 TRINITY_DN40291_c0_g1~~TRINITY_DN40291_c0_g1_i1.p1  ORF type:complete len:168 (+),score=44.98 TRINITY_DN40291_c0_g1_i1:114-617(+)
MRLASSLLAADSNQVGSHAHVASKGQHHASLEAGDAAMIRSGKEPSDFLFGGFKLPGSAGAGLGAAAGAGLGGMAVFHMTSKKCVAPPMCQQVKECMASAAKKAFVGAAVAGGAASIAGDKLQDKFSGSAMPLDEWTAGPMASLWSSDLPELRQKVKRDESSLRSFF